MTTPLAYLNGRFLPFTEAALPLHDAGFVSGATIVDNARTFRHRLFRWPDHLERFRRDCATCYVPLKENDEQLTAITGELIAHNAKLLPPGGELQLVTFATPGPLGFYLGEATNGPPTLGMVTYPLPFARYRKFFTEGVTLALAGSQHADSADLLSPVPKQRSRMHWHIAERSINDPVKLQYCAGAVPVIFNHQGIGDTAIGGILAATNDVVLFPVAGTVQESISVKVTKELCDSVGIMTQEAPLDLRYFTRPPRADEAMTFVPRVSEFLLAGTGFCLAGVRRIAVGGQHRNYDWPGPSFKKLLAAWSDLVGVNIEKQFTE